GEYGIGLLRREADHDERARRGIGIAPVPGGVGGADGPRQVVGGTEDVNGAGFTVVADGDAEALLLRGRKRVANARDGADKLGPADFFAQILAVRKGKLLERA